MRPGKFWLLILIVAGVLVWSFVEARSFADAQRVAGASPRDGSSVFTPAHRSLRDAVNEFFNIRPIPVQPIAYTHKVHLANGMQCTDCHTSVEQGPVASIPGVKLCMICHQVIATEKPQIKKLAGYLERGEEIPWQRVYNYNPSAHVKFNHAPHVRAGVACASCHGDMTKQTVAVRAVNLTMGYCINCHKQKKASIECVTCHF